MGRLVECNACGHWQVNRTDFPECECCGCLAMTPLPYMVRKIRLSFYFNHKT
jgi:hypothetical protein